MLHQQKPNASPDATVVASTRLPVDGRAEARALAELRGVSVCALLRDLLVPAVRETLRAEVAKTSEADGWNTGPKSVAALLGAITASNGVAR